MTAFDLYNIAKINSKAKCGGFIGIIQIAQAVDRFHVIWEAAFKVDQTISIVI